MSFIYFDGDPQNIFFFIRTTGFFFCFYEIAFNVRNHKTELTSSATKLMIEITTNHNATSSKTRTCSNTAVFSRAVILSLLRMHRKACAARAARRLIAQSSDYTALSFYTIMGNFIYLFCFL